ncbi:uncharacterized protein LOC129590579 [Paramacrobiotus metropolitanus]|uniref:uncharacterized protein LOC129590579 n=1 Tax=Paramacrobiotus metropolitanus TaxID=2943436 RepID=UPI0024457FC2|nr:uncharacterized protein LOC129590579 [Paramacrobiotus metropolitanus]
MEGKERQTRTSTHASLLEERMGSFQIYLRCDSVDVWENSGLLRYGRVVDVADNGLFIDFLCPDRRCELTPFDRIFKMFSPACATDLDLGKVGERCPVEVLLRPSPALPGLGPCRIVSKDAGNGPSAKISDIPFCVEFKTC